MNLKTAFPRSPKEMMNGLAHIPRIIDKARAYKQNALGEYIYPCPLDKIVFEFIEIDAEEFANFVTANNETQIQKWIAKKCKDRTDEEKAAINKQILERSPKDKEQWTHFNEIRNKIDPSRTDIKTWVDLIDLEEGRL